MPIESGPGPLWDAAIADPPSESAAPSSTNPLSEPPHSRLLRAAALVSAVLLAGGGLYLGLRPERPQGPATPTTLELTRSEGTLAPSPTAELIEKVLPSVVNVRTKTVGRDFFGGQTQSEGQGSGVIVGQDGIILTNNHVVAGATSVEVVFNDDVTEPITGTVLGTDLQHDLAVIKVDTKDLQPLEIGSSDDLRLGDTVIAIGFPLQLGGPTVTQGIVSGLDRAIDIRGGSGVEQLTEMLQTDAAINPGNSGGALIDAAGRLIGINTAAAQAGAAENIGFAIPIDVAAPIAERIAEKPAAARAWMGVEVASVGSAAEASQLGLPLDTRGALIVTAIPGGPAEDAGLVEGEVVVSLNGSDIAAASDLIAALNDLEPGDVAELQVVSSSGTRDEWVTLGRRPVE